MEEYSTQTKEQRILNKFSELKDERQTWEKEYEEIATYVFPRRSNWEHFDGRATKQGKELFDGTPISALNLLANGLVGYLVSPATRWFKLRLSQNRFNNIPGVRKWLEISENVLYDEFSRSNFYQEIVEYFRDGGGFGTATMFVQEDLQRNLPNYSTRHPKEVYIAEDQYGHIDTVFRRFSMTARQMEATFGFENLSNTVKEILRRQANERIMVIHAVYPRTDRDVNKINNKNKPFASVYIEEDRQHILRESGFDRLPYVVWRYSTNSDEVYGRGPGYEALSDVKKSNTVSKTMLDSAQLLAKPPLNVPAHLRGQDINWIPRGLNYYENPQEVVTPANHGTQYEPGLEREQHIQQIIETHFMVDFFLMLQRAPEGMTATEVMERQAEKAAVLGTVIGRIASEFLDPVIDLTFEIAQKQGKIPPPPPQLLQIIQESGSRLEIDYIGPLAQAQKKFHVTQGVQQSVQAVIPLMQVNPGISDLIDWDEVTMQLMRAHGMPESAIRDKRLVQKLRQQRAAQQQQAAQAEQANEMMKSLPKEMPDTGTAMNQLNKQLTSALKQQNPDTGESA